MTAPLVLVPTEKERAILLGHAALPLRVECCGFGLVAAAARSAALIASHAPSMIWLAGIAGSFDEERLPPGSAFEFHRLGLDGIGAGEGASFLGPRAMGFPLWEDRDGAIHDRLETSSSGDHGLLSVCSASGDREQARRRQEAHPGFHAEDMEAFGVAFAARLHRVPLRVVRGISNLCGDRDHRRWLVHDALAAVAAHLEAHLDAERAP